MSSALELHPRLRAIELRGALLTALFGLPFGVFFGVGAVWLACSTIAMSLRYESGTPATRVRLIEMSVSERIIAHADATVSYADSRGIKRLHRLSIERFLAVPEPDAALQVRYSAEDPAVAVSSWERESLRHALVMAFALALLSGFFVWSTARSARVGLGRLRLATQLAQMGQLVQVEILDSKRDELGMRVMLRYRYRTPNGTVLTASIPSSEGGAYRVDESPSKSLALLAPDERRGVLLTRSGYPVLNASERLQPAR